MYATCKLETRIELETVISSFVLRLNISQLWQRFKSIDDSCVLSRRSTTQSLVRDFVSSGKKSGTKNKIKCRRPLSPMQVKIIHWTFCFFLSHAIFSPFFTQPLARLSRYLSMTHFLSSLIDKLSLPSRNLLQRNSASFPPTDKTWLNRMLETLD